MTMTEKPAPSSATGSSPKSVLVMCFLIVLLDGLDTNAITFTAPLIAREWGLSAAAMAPTFLATSIGAVIGYMVCGPVALRIGDRKTVLASILLFAFGTLATAFARDLVTLTVLRLLTSVGLGGALPIAVATATRLVSDRYRTTAAIFVATGLSVGAFLGGALGGPLIARFGWTSIYILGGVLPLALLPLVAKMFGDSDGPTRAAAGAGNPVLQLFRDGLARSTVLLWLFAFLMFVVSYALIFWLPTLVIKMGLPLDQAPASAAAFALGGVIGNAALVLLIARLGAVGAMMLAVVVGVLFSILFGTMGSAGLVLPFAVGLGAGCIPCCVGQSAMAVAFYPLHLRATGIGWAAAIGRIGSIFGPGVGGLVIARDWPAQQAFLLALVPMALAFTVLLMLRPGTDNLRA